MLLYEYKLRLSRAQQAAIDEAIRTTQFIRNTCVRLWMDGRSVSANDLQTLCSHLAQEYPFAARLNSQARQAAARAWAAIERFYTNCRERRPGKKGYPRFQRDCRSVEYKQTGWRLDVEGKDAEPQPKEFAEFQQSVKPRDPRVLFGALDYSQLSFMERMVVKGVRAPDGDFRDWTAIEEWAESSRGR
jgi:transposase